MKSLIIILSLSFFVLNSIDAQIHYNHPKFMEGVYNCPNCKAESEYQGHQIIECIRCKKSFGDECCVVRRPIPQMPRRSRSYCPHCDKHWDAGEEWRLLGILDVRI